MEVLFFLVPIAFVMVAQAIIDHMRLARLSRERGAPNICEFARSFDYRAIDTAIIREVWNEVQQYLGNYHGKPFPLHADDHLAKAYGFSPDDLDEIYWRLADRLGIDVEHPETNPFFNKVTSIRNLVMFLHHQPSIAQ